MRIQLYYNYITKGVSYGKEIDYSKKKIQRRFNGRHNKVAERFGWRT